MNCIIRRAVESDIPAIIELFKLSLGREGGAPIDEFWKWKHINNPFGESPVLLAFHETKLIGLRAFMRWRWRMNDKIFPAFRAVDTATHPDYRGKGIFSILTKQLISELTTTEPSSFIFNTPNDQSKPGYIKMGWKVLGNAPISASFKLIINKNSDENYEYYVRQLKDLDFDEIKLYKIEGKISRDNSQKYLQWRYRDIPELKYGCYKYEDNGKQVYLFFHLKNRKHTKELRICDYAGVDPVKDKNIIMRSLKKLASELGTPLITFIHSIPFSRWEKVKYAIAPLTSFAPEITIRQINDERLFDTISHIEKWSFTMGDLEIF